MTCDFDRIDALCAGELPESQRASVLAHMEHCPACRAYYEAMAGLEGDVIRRRLRESYVEGGREACRRSQFWATRTVSLASRPWAWTPSR